MDNMYKDLNELMPALEAFRAKNVELLAQWENLQEEKSRLEDEMKSKCRELGATQDIGIALFQFVPSYRKWIDYDKAYDAMKTKAQRLQLGEITKVEKIVDMKKFIDLTREGVFPESVRVSAYKEEQLTPKILIKYKEAQTDM